MDSTFIGHNRQIMKQKMREHKNSIEAMLKQFKYQQRLSVNENMKKLCMCLENIMNVESLEDFAKFLSTQEHLPIEVNLKALKYENLVQIFQDWLNSTQDHPMHYQRNTSHGLRNILFKRIFLEEKQTIKDFFQTISEKKKLRDVDLYQLLMVLLGPYFLYEYNSDTQTFFYKTNSFENFMKVVNTFVKNARRAYTRDRGDANDQSYIRLHQFQQLIQFWENLNPQLTLQEEARKNKNDIGIQTMFTQLLVHSQTQTEKQSSRSYLNVINSALYEVNSMISKQNDPELLASLDIVFDALRSQKLFAINFQEKQRRRFRKKSQNHMLDSNHSSEAKQIVSPLKERHVTPTKNRLLPRKIIPNTRDMTEVISFSPHKDEDDITIIYNYLCSKDALKCLTISELQIFFYRIGLTKAHENFLVKNLLKQGYIEDKYEISLQQFKNIIEQLKKQSKKINSKVLKNYISNCQELEQIRGTAYFKNNSRSPSPRNSTTHLSKSQFHNRSILGKDSAQGTTFLLDSDASCM